MYAVIATGGKQYRVEAGTVLRIELLTAEAGTEVKFSDVLLVGSGESVTVGSPKVAGASVTATVQRHGQGDKVSIVKFRRRKHYLRMKNHRQKFTEIKVTGIHAG
jgi:large subunit ribosomal protein L21